MSEEKFDYYEVKHYTGTPIPIQNKLSRPIALDLLRKSLNCVDRRYFADFQRRTYSLPGRCSLVISYYPAGKTNFR